MSGVETPRGGPIGEVPEQVSKGPKTPQTKRALTNRRVSLPHFLTQLAKTDASSGEMSTHKAKFLFSLENSILKAKELRPSYPSATPNQQKTVSELIRGVNIGGDVLYSMSRERRP